MLPGGRWFKIPVGGLLWHIWRLWYIYIHSMRSSFYYPAEFQIRTIHSAGIAGLGGGSWGSPVLCCLGTTMGCCCNQTELLQRLGTAGPWQLQEVPDQSSQTLSQNASKCIQYVYHSYILIYYNHTHNYINCYHSIMIRLATITITLCTKYLKTYTHTHTYICVCICTVIWLQYHIVSWLSIVIAAKQVLWQCDPSPSAEGHPGAPTGFGKGKSTANGGFELGKIIWKYGKTWKNPTLVIEVSEFLAGKLNKLKLNGIVFWSPMEKWDVASLPGDDGWYGASFILRSCGLSTCHDAMATRYGLPEMGNSTQNGTLNEECDNFLLGVTPASGRKTLMITYIVSDAQGCYVDVGRSGGCSTRPATSRLHSRGQSHAGQSSGRGLEQRRYWQIESPMPGRSNIDHDEHWTLMNHDFAEGIFSGYPHGAIVYHSESSHRPPESQGHVAAQFRCDEMGHGFP